jgi:hypothetical protein
MTSDSCLHRILVHVIGLFDYSGQKRKFMLRRCAWLILVIAENCIAC